MNPDPDYSAAYVVIRTDAEDGLEGHGFAFTIGRGNDVQVAAIRALEPFIVGLALDETLADWATSARRLVHDSQLRWLGPEKGVMHMAIAAVVNALWDLRRQARGQAAVEAAVGPVARGARRARRLPLPDRRADARRGAGDPAARAARPGGARARSCSTRGYPAYTTTPGWLGYSDDKLARLCREAVADGFTQIKLKVGADLDDDVRRLRIAREACGPDIRDRGRRQPALGRRRRDRAGSARSAPFDPYWVEEPTSPDDVLGHAAIRARRSRRSGSPPASTSRTASSSSSCCRPRRSTSCRSTPPASPASTRTSRSCCWRPSSACRSARTPAASACASWSSTWRCSTTSPSPARSSGRVIEYVDHLHEHFVDPVVIRGRALPRAAAAGLLGRDDAGGARRAPVPGRRRLGDAGDARMTELRDPGWS